MRAATCLYWTTSANPDLFSVDELARYAEGWRFQRQPDADKEWSREEYLRAFVHMHASAALLVKLHADEGGQSERASEVVKDMVGHRRSGRGGYISVGGEPDTFYREMPGVLQLHGGHAAVVPVALHARLVLPVSGTLAEGCGRRA